MRRTARSIRLLVSAAVLLVVVGAYPAAAGSSPAGDPDGPDLAAFEATAPPPRRPPSI